jgi:hypothetical protein
MWGNDKTEIEERVHRWNIIIKDCEQDMIMISGNLDTGIRTRLVAVINKVHTSINAEGSINGEVDRRIQNNSKFYHIMKGLLWNRVIPEQQSMKYI